MRRRRSQEVNFFGTSFLDVLANTIGGLAFLLVMAALLAGGGDEVLPDPLKITTKRVPVASKGQPLDFQFAADGGIGYYGWRIAAGSLPGVTLSPEGRLSGTPPQRGDFPFTISVTDKRSRTDSKQFTLNVGDPAVVPKPLRVKTSVLPEAIAARLYAVNLSAEGGSVPYSWQPLESGHPSWIKTDATGEVRGTPDKPGDFALRWRVTDSFGNTAESAPLALKVLPPLKPVPELVLRTRATPKARAGEAYEATLAAFGGAPPYHWQAEGLPPGMRLSEDRLTGLPSKAGDYAASITVRDSDGQQRSAKFDWKVEPAVADLRVVTARAPDGIAGGTYTLALAGDGGIGPYLWRLEKGELPPGLQIEAGKITGMPSRSGEWEVTLALRDARGVEARGALAMKVLTAEKHEPLRVETRGLPAAVHGRPYEVALSASGGRPPYQWEAKGLPEGLSVVNGVLSGRPKGSGEFEVQLTASDGSQKAQSSAGLKVSRMVDWWLALVLTVLLLATVFALVWLFRRTRSDRQEVERQQVEIHQLKENLRAAGAEQPPLEILTAELPNARASCAYTVRLACQGGCPPYAWRLVGGELPPGMQLLPDGTLCGKPFENVAIGETREVAFEVEVTDAVGQAARKML